MTLGELKAELNKIEDDNLEVSVYNYTADDYLELDSVEEYKSPSGKKSVEISVS